ncbi:MAG: hypothetical protein KF862_23220 [Chitinophagaceae bacterium]|nr:hypothetical protein [Chitinophagaceae bacterium]
MLDILYDSTQQRFYYYHLNPSAHLTPPVKAHTAGFKGDSLTCFTLSKAGKRK